MKTVTYKLFGFIPVWRIIISHADEEDLYERLANRFRSDLNTSLNKARRGEL